MKGSVTIPIEEFEKLRKTEAKHDRVVDIYKEKVTDTNEMMSRFLIFLEAQEIDISQVLNEFHAEDKSKYIIVRLNKDNFIVKLK